MKQLNQNTMRRLISIGMLLFFTVLFTILAPGQFMNVNNLMSIVRDASVVGIVGVGVTYVIITSGIDLSTGSMMGVVCMTMAVIYKYTLIPIPIMLLIGILVGLLCGLINGIIVGHLHVPEFIATLSTQIAFRALTYIIAVRDQYGSIASQPMTLNSFTFWGGSIGPVYLVTIAMILFIVVGEIVLKNTSFGTNLYAIGSNRKAATLSGINVAKTVILAYVVVGFCTAVGGIFTAARLQSVTALVGNNFEFNAIAAAVIGGVSLAGGSGDLIGTFIGAIFMALIDNGIRKLGLDTAYQYLIKGLIIILVVIFDAVYRRHMERVARERGAKEGLA